MKLIHAILTIFLSFQLTSTIAQTNVHLEAATLTKDSLHSQTIASSPVGQWRTFGDSGSQPQALVRISEDGGVLTGALIENLVSGEDLSGTCNKCSGAHKDVPLAGMAFLTALKLRDGEYRDCEILDPETGSVYHCTLKILDAGRKLVVRGYVGLSLFGRSQEWIRAD